MAETDDPTAMLIPLGPPSPGGAPAVGYKGDNDRDPTKLLQPLGGKPVLSTSFERVPSKEGGEGSIWGNLGLGTRAAVTGLTSLPAAVADVATWPGRMMTRAAGLPTTAPSDMIGGAMDAAGLPRPQTPGDQARADIISGAASMLTPMGIAQAAPRMVAQLPTVVRPLVATPGASGPQAAGQVAAGGVGAAVGDELASSEHVPEWLKPTARLVGNIAGAGGVNAISSFAGRAKNALGGVQNDVAMALERLGIVPKTAAAVTQGSGVSQMEGLMVKSPFASGRLLPAQRDTVEQFGDALEHTAQQLGPHATAEEAGTAVQKALHDWRSNAFPAEQTAIWAPLNQRMAGAAVDPAPYRRALEYAASPPALASLPENQRAFASAQARKWLEALNADVPSGQMMSWEQAHALKTRIGDAMGTPDIVASLGNKQLQGIYGGLAQGMERAATQHGQADLFRAANDTTIAGHQFIDGTVSKAARANNPAQETIRPDAAARALVGDNTALQQLRDRVPAAADALAAWKLREMSQARPSQQGAGATTSTGTFLTEARKLQLQRPEGASALFGGVRQPVDDLMRVAAKLREMEAGINKSNTGPYEAITQVLPQTATMGFASGLPAALATLAASVGAPWATGRFLTNPDVIRLMAAKAGRPSPLSARQAGLLINQSQED